jgi:RNA polymerase sigma-70 factor (ECF subfamily)
MTLREILGLSSTRAVGRVCGNPGGPSDRQSHSGRPVAPFPQRFVTLLAIERGTEEGVAGDIPREVAAARSGDRAALERLLRDHYDQIYAVCHRLVGNDADAADAAQQTMISVVRALAKFDGRSSFSTWAYRIAHNASIDLLRSRSRRPAASLDELTGRSIDPPVPDAVGAVDERVDIAVALQGLPVEFRGPVVLRDLCGLDYAEIGEVLRLPPGTVRSRIARGRAMLADAVHPARSEM